MSLRQNTSEMIFSKHSRLSGSGEKEKLHRLGQFFKLSNQQKEKRREKKENFLFLVENEIQQQ
jgi:hypothetical protein